MIDYLKKNIFKGIKVLTNASGNVGMEKFISLLLREPFDYTKC